MKVDKSKWVESTLGYCLISLRTGLNPRLNFKLNEPGSNNYYITVRELNGRGLTITDKTDKFPDYAFPLINNRSNLEVGDVLFTGTGTIGKTALVSETPQNWNIKEGVYALKPNSELIDSEYLLHYLHSINLMEFCGVNSKGATIQSVPMATLKKAPIILPPLDKQQGIAKELDTIQIMIDGYKAQIADLTELAKSLFLDMFGDPIENSKQWELSSFEETLISLKTGLNPRDNFKLNEAGANNYYVTVRELDGYKIKYHKSTDKVCDYALPLINNRSNLQKGDVLFSGTGTIGRTAYVDTEPKNWNIKEGVYVLKPDQRKINSLFLLHFLHSNLVEKFCRENAKGATIKSVPMKVLKQLKFPLPPLDIQLNFARKIEAIEKQKELLQEQLADTEQLIAERMQYYFS